VPRRGRGWSLDGAVRRRCGDPAARWPRTSGKAAIRSLRAAPVFTGGRGRPALDVAAAACLASAAGEALLESGLELIELNPVLVHERGTTAVDAVAA